MHYINAIGLAHNLVHRICAEPAVGYVPGRSAALLKSEALPKNAYKSRGCSATFVLAHKLIHNNCAFAGQVRLPYFCASIINCFKSKTYGDVDTLAHNLVHSKCAELPRNGAGPLLPCATQRVTLRHSVFYLSLTGVRFARYFPSCRLAYLVAVDRFDRRHRVDH
jgi:hypothetical protein